MTLAPPAAPYLLGSQEPTHRLSVDHEFSRGEDVIDLANMAGLELDEWQQNLLIDGLGVTHRPDAEGNLREKWAAYQVGVELSRQNGKSVVLEARVLAGLFLFREQLIVYSAHQGETVVKAFERIERLIKSNPELHAEVYKDGRSDGFRRANGQLQIKLWTGQIALFRTRTPGGGRGLDGDCVILDESQDLRDDHVAALMPLVSARPNGQLWYAGSAGTKKSVIQGRLVRRAARGSERLVYWRWAGNDDDDPADPRVWARLNPAVGRRMDIESIQSEYEDLSPDGFSQERLGIGDYPREEGEDWVIPRLRWERAQDPQSTMAGPVMFSIAVKWDRSRASIGVSGVRADGRRHLELIANAPGTHWTVAELARLTKDHENLGVVIDPHSQANTLVAPLEDQGIKVHLLKTDDVTQAFGDMYDGLMAEGLGAGQLPKYVHGGGSVLTSSLADAEIRTAGGATTWRLHTTADISPIKAVCDASRGIDLQLRNKRPDRALPQSEADTASSSPRTSFGQGIDFSTVEW